MAAEEAPEPAALGCRGGGGGPSADRHDHADDDFGGGGEAAGPEASVEATLLAGPSRTSSSSPCASAAVEPGSTAEECHSSSSPASSSCGSFFFNNKADRGGGGGKSSGQWRGGRIIPPSRWRPGGAKVGPEAAAADDGPAATDPAAAAQVRGVQSPEGVVVVVAGDTSAAAIGPLGALQASDAAPGAIRQEEGEVEGGGATGDGDDRSVGSSASTAAYFDPSDLSPGYWSGVAGGRAPALALGVAAVAAAVLHPLLFAAGALAAATGAAAAAAAATSEASSTAAAANAPSAEEEEEAEGSSTWFFAWQLLESICFRPSDSAALSEPHRQLPSSVFAAVPRGYDGDGGGGMAPPAPCPGPGPPADDGDAEEADRGNDKGDEEERIHAAYVAARYPRLDCTIVADQVFRGLSAAEFFRVFLDDSAPYNFIEFQRNRGDVDIVYRPWEPAAPGAAEGPSRPPEGEDANHKGRRNLSNLPLPEPALPPGAGEDPAPPSPPRGPPQALAHRQRVVTFKAKTNAIFGPAYAPTTKTQRFELLSKRWAVLESRTELSDIPFSDRFYVVERWIVHATKSYEPAQDGSGSGGGARAAPYSCRVSASCQAVFRKPCGGALEGQIRSKSHSTLLEVARAWCAMAREALRLAEEAKLARLRHDPPPQPDDPADDRPEPEGVEVERGDFLGGAEALRRSESEPDPLRRPVFRTRTRSGAQHRRRRQQQRPDRRPIDQPTQ